MLNGRLKTVSIDVILGQRCEDLNQQAVGPSPGTVKLLKGSFTSSGQAGGGAEILLLATMELYI